MDKYSEKDIIAVKTATKVSVVSLAANVILSIFKLVAGIVGRSMAMVSDAAHSLSDVFGSVVVIIGVRIGRKAPDEDHPYGHEKFECLASLVLAGLLIFTSGMIVFEAIDELIGKHDRGLPSTIALVAAIVSIVMKEALYWYTLIAGRRVESSALKAEAWHHRSDAISSIGSLIGVGGAMLGYKMLDPICAIVIAIIILKVAYNIMKDAVGKMVDKSASPEIIKEMSEKIVAVDGVIKLDLIKTRLFGERMYVEVEICANKDLPLKKSHGIAEQVHDMIEAEYPKVKHCTVHVNPSA